MTHIFVTLCIIFTNYNNIFVVNSFLSMQDRPSVIGVVLPARCTVISSVGYGVGLGLGRVGVRNLGV